MVALDFLRELLQPIQDRAHPAFDYWGQSDPNQVVKRKVSKEEMMALVKNIFGGQIRTGSAPRCLGYTALPTQYVFDLDLYPSYVFKNSLLCA
jgi:hypothetical protein